MNICKEPDCTKKTLARKLCAAHYYKYKRAGTIDEHELAPAPSAHFLSSISETHRSAICQICGPVDIRSNGNHRKTGVKQWECATQRANQRNGKPVNRKYLYEGGELDPTTTHTERKRLELLQNGKCAICKAEPGPNRKRLYLDHCHTTGKIRGLLCHKCNTGLGMFRDNPDILIAATDYLNQ